MINNKNIRFFLALLSLVFWNGCNRSNDTDNETYGQVLIEEYETETMYLPKSRRTYASDSFINAATVKFRFLPEKEFQECKITALFFELQENGDLSVDLAFVANGIVKQENGWTTLCAFYPTVPWDPKNPPDLPYKWTYEQDHLQEPNKAIYHARTDTIFNVTRQKGEQNQVLYPYPPSADPQNVTLDGYTTVLPNSIVNFDEPISLWINSSFVETDHSGNTIEVIFEMKLQDNT